MAVSINETKKVTILAWGLVVVTLLVTDRIGADPVNVGKMLALSVVGFSLVPFIKIPTAREWHRANLWFLFLVGFVVAIFISVFTSANSYERGLYGAYGRNTGLLTYFALSLIFISAAQITTKASFHRIQKSLFIAGYFNILYCCAAAAGKDIITWDNPYGAVLGTFGNPNFIGSFMGIFSGVVFVNLLANPKEKKYKIVLFLSLGLTFVVIYLADALQGLVISIIGISLSLYFYLRIEKKFILASRAYLTFLFFGGLTALLGILQRGPLVDYLYKSSISLRGDYWRTGLIMGFSDPLRGVGIDSYGLYYRTFRPLESAGIDTTTDASHNVFIDFFAGAGIVALICYLSLSILVLVVSLKYIKNLDKFDPIFFTFFIGWVGYQLQSLISINQIGLTIWGWVFGGALIGYTKLDQSQLSEVISKKRNNGKVNPKATQELLEPSLFLKVIVLGLIGLLVALPPFIADTKMRKFVAGKGTTEELIALVDSWPRDTIRLNRAIVLLVGQESYEEAKVLAAMGTTVFPNDFASWSALYELSGEGSKEREAYRNKLHEIDPLNPKYFK
jgi:hypothetical protein